MINYFRQAFESYEGNYKSLLLQELKYHLIFALKINIIKISVLPKLLYSFNFLFPIRMPKNFKACSCPKRILSFVWKNNYMKIAKTLF